MSEDFTLGCLAGLGFSVAMVLVLVHVLDVAGAASREALCSDLAALSDTIVVAREHPVCRSQLLNREEP